MKVYFDYCADKIVGNRMVDYLRDNYFEIDEG